MINRDVFTEFFKQLWYNKSMDDSYTKGNVDYRKLWKLMIDKDIRKKTDLITMAGISTNILAKLNKGDYISMESMQKICKALNCDIGDICVVNEPKLENK